MSQPDPLLEHLPEFLLCQHVFFTFIELTLRILNCSQIKCTVCETHCFCFSLMKKDFFNGV